jgi:hypothetical protein
MQNTKQVIAENLQRYRNGDAGAFFTLIEMNGNVMPELIAAYHKESDTACRAFIVEVLWQRRNPSVIPFLAETLDDPEAEVWQQSLDGLVTLASPESLSILRKARLREFPNQDDTAEFRSWIDEAIEQIDQKIKTA